MSLPSYPPNAARAEQSVVTEEQPDRAPDMMMSSKSADAKASRLRGGDGDGDDNDECEKICCGYCVCCTVCQGICCYEVC